MKRHEVETLVQIKKWLNRWQSMSESEKSSVLAAIEEEVSTALNNADLTHFCHHCSNTIQVWPIDSKKPIICPGCQTQYIISNTDVEAIIDNSVLNEVVSSEG